MLYFLVGFMGAGKTAVGKKLAEKLHVDFIDSDEVIEAKHGMKVGEIFALHGESYFRGQEEEFVMDLNKSRGVVACGGGLPCYNSLMNELLEKGTVIYLKAGVPTLVKRLEKERAARPLLMGEDLEKIIESRLYVRTSCYGKAVITVSTDHLTPEEVVSEILDKIQG